MDRNLVFLVVLALIVYGANTWGTSIYVLDEAKNAGCAMEMHARGDWVVPTFNDALRTDKPPLHYYFMKAAYTVFGVNPFAARLFSVIMGVLTVACVYLFAKDLAGRAAAFWAALILAVSIQLDMQFHLAVPDPYLIFFLTVGLLCFYKGYRDRKSAFYYFFYASVGLAALAKGPVAVVFSGLIVLIFLLAMKQFTLRQLGGIKLLQGILIFCVVAVPWYIFVGIETDGEWLQKFFLEHNVGRFTATMEGHGGFPLASFVIVLGALMPFSFFAPQAIRHAWKERKENSFLLFCLVAMGVVVVFFAFSRTILPSYPEPALPFFAIILGAFFAGRLHPGAWSDKYRWNAGIYAFVSLAIPVAAWLALRQDQSLAPVAPVAAWCLILSAGGVLGMFWVMKKQLKKALYSYAATSVLFLLIFFYAIFPVIDRYNPVTQSLQKMDRDLAVASYRNMNPAFVFGLKEPVPVFKDAKALQSFRARTPAFYLITQSRYLPDIEGIPYREVHRGKDLFESPTTVVLLINE